MRLVLIIGADCVLQEVCLSKETVTIWKKEL
jgi:hypothetical protein